MRRRPSATHRPLVRRAAPFIALCACVMAATAQEPALAAADPDIVELLRMNGAEVAALGNLGGIEGYRVRPEGDPEGYTLYVTQSGHAVMGLLYSPAGDLITGEQLASATSLDESHASPVDPPAAGPPPGHGFTLGHAGPTIRVFADPACRWSRAAVARLASHALDGRLVLEVVPVALLGDASAWMALAAVGEDGAEAWFGHATADRTDELAGRVRRNNDIFAAEGGTAVPLVMWQGPSGTVRHTGTIEDVDALLREIDP